MRSRPEVESCALVERDVGAKDARASALAATKQPMSFFYQRNWQACCRILATNPDMGLTNQEADARRAIHGKNELESEPGEPWWKIFLAQLMDLLVVTLIIAAIVSGAFGEYYECAFILILVFGMTAFGTYLEIRARDSLDALSSRSGPLVDVIRGGRHVHLDSTLLVPGDVILLECGQTICADCRLIAAQGLSCSEAALTGESIGQKKDAEFVALAGLEYKNELGERQENQNIVFMGCTINDGRGKAVVVATGMATEMGKIASLMNRADETPNPLQIKLHRLGKWLGLCSLAMSVVSWIIGVTTEQGLNPHNHQSKYLQMTLLAAALAVATLPEAVPSLVTVTLAMGMNRMSQRNALVRNLHGAVTLAAMSVICTDKTGTLTVGEMTATRLWYDGKTAKFTGLGYKPEGYLVPEETNLDDPGAVKAAHDANAKGIHLVPCAVAALCCNAVVQGGGGQPIEIVGNMTDKPLVVAAMKTGITLPGLAQLFERKHENPFDAKRKLMSTVVKNLMVSNNGDFKTDGGAQEMQALANFPELQGASYFSCVKGAPNYVLAFCTRIMRSNGQAEMLDQEEKNRILLKLDDFSAEALRVLAVAARPFGEEPQDLTPENVERDLILLGLFASIDPPRPELKGAIQTAHKAGIRVVVISGDYTKTLFAISKDIGLLPPDAPERKVIDCERLRDDGQRVFLLEEQISKRNRMNLTPAEEKAIRDELSTIYKRLDKITSYVDVFGRVKPSDKITIVKSLQRQGHITSMTGDGVGDAPVLKQANIGVAMGITGTDTAKAAASMILIDDAFATIVAGVEESRAIFRNVAIVIYMLLSENIAEVFFVLISVCVNQPSPLGAVQLLLLNLFTDGGPAVALALETSGNDALMSEGPRKPDESIISPIMFVGIVIHSTILCGMCCLNYTLALIRYTGSGFGLGGTQEELSAAATVAFLYITCSELLRAYTCRSLRESVFRIGVFSNRWLQKPVLVGFVGAIALTVIPGLNTAVGFAQLKGEDWAYILCTMWVPCICEEVLKFIFRLTGFGLRPVGVRGKRRSSSRLQSIV